jgi:hypothetical protein
MLFFDSENTKIGISIRRRNWFFVIRKVIAQQLLERIWAIGLMESYSCI